MLDQGSSLGIEDFRFEVLTRSYVNHGCVSMCWSSPAAGLGSWATWVLVTMSDPLSRVLNPKP